MNLINFYKNKYSQNGEDGIIAEILSKIFPNKKGFVVEFGAWDGINFSNTFLLVENGWDAIYIESDLQKFKLLQKTQEKYKNIIAVNSLVSNRNKDEFLDNILEKHNCPKVFEILSIDIDSYDIDVWESLKRYKPKIVIIEINSSIPPGIRFRHKDFNCGCTFSSAMDVAFKKNYSLICHTGNLIFICNDYLHLLDINNKFLEYPEVYFLKNETWLESDIKLF